MIINCETLTFKSLYAHPVVLTLFLLPKVKTHAWIKSDATLARWCRWPAGAPRASWPNFVQKLDKFENEMLKASKDFMKVFCQGKRSHITLDTHILSWSLIETKTDQMNALLTDDGS